MVIERPSVVVPIIGLPFRAFEAQVTVIILCNCNTSNEPMLLQGIENAKACSKCQNVYAITALHYERGKTPRVQVAVSLVGKVAQRVG